MVKEKDNIREQIKRAKIDQFNYDQSNIKGLLEQERNKTLDEVEKMIDEVMIYKNFPDNRGIKDFEYIHAFKRELKQQLKKLRGGK